MYILEVGTQLYFPLNFSWVRYGVYYFTVLKTKNKLICTT